MTRLRKAKASRADPDQAYKEPLPDLVLLDLMLSDMSGAEVCRELRTHELTRHIPIIMLTAKEEEIGRVVGFAVGTDDYVVKPFSVRELILRIRAVLRCFQPRGGESTPTTYGILRLDTEAHRVWVGGEEITLTALEFKLLAFLLARRGRVQSREQLLSDVWGIDGEVTTRTVDTHVKRLRHKLGEAAGYVETLRGVGYRFSAMTGRHHGRDSRDHNDRGACHQGIDQGTAGYSRSTSGIGQPCGVSGGSGDLARKRRDSQWKIGAP